ncbi:hypothetical protein FHW12_001468 [Dokdonella fugitiva]|uniref:Uncharacterized protein n=1 Tax=Dokdonella fugitiva TaxID=328517 RepID=A0A839F4P8_9GAMM|nr:hypothetical protein [Dokdonella fugitiva]MBA8887254.1 hypothetical protein [Dokdonella fugitiva]
MNAAAPEAARLEALAARLGLEPHALLVLFARRAAQAGQPFDRERLQLEIERLRDAPAAMQAAAALARLGPGAYALDDIDNALGMIWADVAER